MAETSSSAPLELGTEKIGKLLKQYAWPAIIAMTASSLYNMVDSIYIGQGVGPLAISGLAVTFPLMNLSTAFGTLVGAGAATILSVFLGRKKYSACNKVLSNVVSLNIIIGAIFMLVSLLFLDDILYFFGASENTLPHAREYMRIILYGNIITHLYFGLNAAMRSTGNPKKAMGLTIFTVIINAILDPIFIFGCGMGIAGAAWATVISQTLALTVVMAHFSNFDRSVHFKKGIFRLNFKIAKESLVIGAGPFLMNAAACLVTLFINQQLRDYSGDLGIGAYGICNRIIFMFIMICMGLFQGMQPIAGYNYGARQYSRVKEVFWKTVRLASIVTTSCFLIAILIPDLAVGVFTHDKELTGLASRAFTILALGFPTVGFQMITTNFFQALGMVKKSVILSLSRQILFLLPLLYSLPFAWGADGVWASFPFSDILSCLLAAWMLRGLFRKFNMLKDGENPDILGSNL